MTMQTRRPLALLALLGAAASATLAPLSAAAQPAAEEAPAAADIVIAPESAPLPEGREARLDALFERLATAETGPHERWENEIRRVWSRSGSDTADLLLQRGRDAMAREDARRAVEHLSALVEHRPDFAEGWNLRATAFFSQGQLGLALADIERTIALEPRHYGALMGLGVILEQLGREADALAAYRAAHALNPHLERVGDAVERLAPKVDGRDA